MKVFKWIILEFFKKYMPEGGSKYYKYLKKDIKHLVGGYFLPLVTAVRQRGQISGKGGGLGPGRPF